MKKYNKLMYIYFIVVGFVLIFYKDVTNLTIDVKNNLEYVKCGTADNIPRPFPQIVSIAYTLLVVVTPILLIIFSILTLVKAVMSGTGEEIEKAKKGIFKKFLIAAIIFSIGVVVRFTVNQFTSNDIDKDTAKSCIKCFLFYSADNCEMSGSDYSDDGERYKQSSKSNYVNSNIKKKSNNNSSSGSVSYGEFTSEKIDKIALFKMSYEGGVDPSTGEPKYDNFGWCYKYKNEKSITLGAGGWYAQNAQILLKEIRKQYPDAFRKYDTANINDDVDNANWGAFCVDVGSSKYKALVNIINSPEGRKVQDEMIRKNITDYIQEANEKFDLHDNRAIVLFMQVRHIFGPGNLQRNLFDHLNKPYNLDDMYNYLMNSSSFNYLPGYKNRYRDAKKLAEELF